MSFLSFLGFGKNPIRELLHKGAVIVDVRTVYEYDQGRVPRSINIPTERLSASLERIQGFEKPVIICSSGDGRSGQAARFLKKNGIVNVYDGGSWQRLLRLLNE